MLSIEKDYSKYHRKPQQITSNSISPIYPWVVWGLAAAFFLAEYFARIAPGIMVPELMSTFHVNALSLGSLSAIFYTAYVGMQMPVGSIIDRFGSRYLLAITAALCAAGCLLFASAEHLIFAKCGRFLMGFGASFAFVGTLKLATIWFPPSRLGFLSGLTQALGMVGAATAAGPLALVVGNVGWRMTLVLIAVVLLCLALLIFFIVRDQPTNGPYQATVPKLKNAVNFWGSFGVVFKNPQSWLNSLYIGLIYAPTAGFGELWGTSYLSRVYNLDRTVAANAISFIFLGLAIGCPIMGWISDKLKRRKPVMIGAAVASLLLMSSALYIPQLSISYLFILFFFYGIANSGFVTSYALASENNIKAVIGTSVGFANMASVLIGACFQPIIGWFLDLQWDGQYLNGTPVYSIESFRHSMMLLPLCFLVSICLTFLIKETHCRSKANEF
jgi:sugar phosphate permease